MNPLSAAHLLRPALVDDGRSLLTDLAGIGPIRHPQVRRRGQAVVPYAAQGPAEICVGISHVVSRGYILGQLR